MGQKVEIWDVGVDQVEDGLLDLAAGFAEDKGLDAVVLELTRLGNVVDDEEGSLAVVHDIGSERRYLDLGLGSTLTNKPLILD